MHRAESGEKEMVVKLGNAGAEVHENVSEHSKTAGQSQTHPVQAKIAQGSMWMHRTHARTHVHNDRIDAEPIEYLDYRGPLYYENSI